MTLLVLGYCLTSSPVSFGQDEHEQLLETLGAATVQENGETVWRFGLKITSKGGTRGITATCPIPIEWPEQTVVEISRDSTPNVSRISIKKLTSDVQQMLIKVNQLGDGEVAQATLTFRINKSVIEKPEDTTKLQFAKKVPSSLRKYLRPSPYIESGNRIVKEAANSIELDDSLSDWEKVETIYRWVRENVEYQFDTQIHSCMEALESGHGDCEELSSLFIAICRIKNIPARAVWIPSHTYPEFYMEDSEGNGTWFPCEAAGSYAFGTMNQFRPILQKGDKFKVPGNPKPTRYVQPTLVAKSGQPQLEWISEQVVDEKPTDDR